LFLIYRLRAAGAKVAIGGQKRPGFQKKRGIGFQADTRFHDGFVKKIPTCRLQCLKGRYLILQSINPCMKRNLLLLFTVLLLSMGTTMANTVVVKGIVKDSSNNPVANRTVRIYNNDSTNTSCLIGHTVVTNPNGYYSDTLQCSGDIRKLMIVVENCNGEKIIQQPTSTSSVVEVNFVICVPGTAPANCKAGFSATANSTGFKFSSSNSVAPAGDSIISRTWVFGDSSQPLTGNRVDPTHDYTKAGVYNVCLTIKTKKGCESSFCTTVEFKPTLSDCFVEVHANTERSSILKFRFTSNNVKLLPGDSVVLRSWTFGDGTSLQNVENPIKEYKDTGIYNVCVKVKTARGCEHQFCFTVDARDTVVRPTTCTLQPIVSFERLSTFKFQFISAKSTTAQGDSIVSRKWNFGDGTVNDGNEISPLKEYKDTGKYTVTVVMKTKGGCEKTFYLVALIRDTLPQPSPVNCKAYFISTIKDSIVYFSSKGSSAPDGDSIISRTWYYIDSASNTQLVLNGNTIDTFINYHAKPGKYTVYLVIKTKKGCESKFSGTVVIPAPIVSCTLQPILSFEKLSAYKFRFISSQSTAQGDSIISRNWNFGDGTTLGGNEISPLKEYKDTGKYTVTVVMKTKNGCEKTFYLVALVRDSIPQPIPTNCKAVFSFTIQNNSVVKFNSAGSAGTSADDEIISRTWIFGDSTTAGSNSVDPSHTYTKPGTYNVFLYIKTKKGCESKFTATVVITPTPTNCPVDVNFVATRISPKKVQFNSEQSHGVNGDSIIQRKWKFGDGTVLEGNTINPVKEFPMIGIYNTCLEVKTAKGCAAQVCKQVAVQDTTTQPTLPNDHIKLVTLTPNPVVTRMLATIWSSGSIEVEIVIFDVYGLPKLKMKKVLTQSTNIIEIPAGNLYRGPYYLTVSSKNEKDSKIFYKL
jgi:PKD repeat protein